MNRMIQLPDLAFCRNVIATLIYIILFLSSLYGQESQRQFGYAFGQRHLVDDNSLTPEKPPRFSGITPFNIQKQNTLEEWNPYPIFGGEILSIASDPNKPEIVYIGTRNAGVFKTTNGGDSWVPSRQNLSFYPIRSLVINPLQPNILYAGTDYDGVWKSTDEGTTWFKSSAGLDESLIVFALVIDPNNPDIIIAGLGGGTGFVIGSIYRSSNSGQTWVISDSGMPRYGTSPKTNAIFSLVIDTNNPQLITAGTNFIGAFQSTDGGVFWSAINDSLPFRPNSTDRESVTGLAVNPYPPHHLSGVIGGKFYVFQDNHTWLKVCSNYCYFGGIFPESKILYHTSLPEIIYIANNFTGFFKSTDGGVNWDELNSNVGSIAFQGTNSNLLYGTLKQTFDYEGGAATSLDGGTTWNDASQGITAIAIRSVAIDRGNTNNIFAGTGYGHLFRSQDGGLTWNKSITSQGYLNFGELSDIAVYPSNTQIVFATGDGGLFRSSDSGNTFTEVVPQISFPMSIVFGVQRSAPVYVGSTFYGIYKSSDGGLTWIQKNQGLPTFGNLNPVLSLCSDPLDSMVVWAGMRYGCGIVKSSDAGEHWQVMGLTEENSIDAIAVNPSNSNEILAGAGFWTGNLYKSTDRGLSWQKKLLDIPFVFDIVYDPSDHRKVYAATEGSGIMRSLDGGETWQLFSNGIFYPVTYSLTAGIKDSAFLIAGSYGSGLYWIYPSSNPSVVENGGLFPLSFTLSQNYPNPFNSTTKMNFTISLKDRVTLKVFNIQGTEVAVLVDETVDAGEYTVSWFADKFPSGIYFYRLVAGSLSITKSMVLLK